MQLRNFETYSYACSCVFIFLIFDFLVAVLCISCKCFLRENLDHARHISRICCCSCYNCWICTLCGMIIHANFWLLILLQISFLLWNMESNFECGVVPLYDFIKDQWFEKSWCLGKVSVMKTCGCLNTYKSPKTILNCHKNSLCVNFLSALSMWKNIVCNMLSHLFRYLVVLGLLVCHWDLSSLSSGVQRLLSRGHSILRLILPCMTSSSVQLHTLNS